MHYRYGSPAGQDPVVSALRVLDIGRTLGDDEEWYPTVVVDVAGRPDVADLARVHAVEGVGDLASYVTASDGGLLLEVALSHPVECRFGIDFRLPEHLPLIVDAAESGRLLVATTPPEDHDAGGDPEAAVVHPAWLALYLDRQLLVSALAEIAAGESPSGEGDRPDRGGTRSDD